MKQQWNILALGFLYLSGSLHAADNKQSNAVERVKSNSVKTIPAVPVLVGYKVFSQIHDLHNSVGNLLTALSSASDTFGYADVEGQQASLRRMKMQLNEIEQRLTRKTDIADDRDWHNYFNESQFNATVHESVRDLGLILNSIAHGMEGGSRTTPKMPYRASNDVIDRVSDVRNEVSELISALDSSKMWPEYAHALQDGKQLGEYMRKLQEIEIALDRKDAKTDEAWLGWFRGTAYKATIQSAIADMGRILNGLSVSLSGRGAKS